MGSTKHSADPVLLGISTTVPETSYTQEFAADFMMHLPAYSKKHSRFIQRLYANTAIDKRHTVIDDYGKEPADFTFFPKNRELLPEPGVEQRNDLFIRESNALSAKAVQSLFDRHREISPDRVTHLITVSCTGFSAPGFDLHLISTIGLPPSTHRFHLGFMGCYAAFPALKLARDICRSEADAVVLIAIVELCSLHFQQKTELDFIIANSLFADGASAALVLNDGVLPGRSRPPRLSLEGFRAMVIPNSESDMAWKLGANAFDMRLSSYVPALIEQNVGEIIAGLLAPAGLSADDVDTWAIHPGGRAILDRFADTLGLPREALGLSYDVLRQYGNMSSATILFVLDRVLERSRDGVVFAAAFGPGLTVETGLLRKVS